MFACPHVVALGAWPLTDTEASSRSTVTVVSTVATLSNSSSRRLISTPPEIDTPLPGKTTKLVSGSNAER